VPLGVISELSFDYCGAIAAVMLPTAAVLLLTLNVTLPAGCFGPPLSERTWRSKVGLGRHLSSRSLKSTILLRSQNSSLQHLSPIATRPYKMHSPHKPIPNRMDTTQQCCARKLKHTSPWKKPAVSSIPSFCSYITPVPAMVRFLWGGHASFARPTGPEVRTYVPAKNLCTTRIT
jgi:hypothetical protein